MSLFLRTKQVRQGRAKVRYRDPSYCCSIREKPCAILLSDFAPTCANVGVKCLKSLRQGCAKVCHSRSLYVLHTYIGVPPPLVAGGTL